jgi:hypothetical protein
MALVIQKDDLPGSKAASFNALSAVKYLTSQGYRDRVASTASNLWDEYVEDVKALKYTAPAAWESYKEDLQAIGVNNIGDFAKWTLLNIAGAGLAVLAGKIISIGFSALTGLGAVGNFATTTLGIMSAMTLQPLVSTTLQQGIQVTGQAINFDINQTDEDLWKQLENKVNGMYGLLGTTVGSAMGWLVCGALPNSAMFRFNKAVGVAIAQDLNEEARGELYGYIGQIIRLSTQTVINSEAINRFSSTRRELKRNPDTDFARFVRSIIGEDTFKKWGEKGQQPWTIKKDIIEKNIAKEKDPLWKQFYENTLEGFTESCIEASMIVANNIDTYIATQKIARTNMLGRVQTVRIRLGESVRDTLYKP